jgi:NAD+ synthase (glutamine-hydrolysing)
VCPTRTLDAVARLRVALCQIDTTAGDLSGNADRVLAALAEAEDAGCDLAVFPELALTGYPPEDLLLKPGFIADNRRALSRVADATRRCAAVVGFVDEGRDLHDAAAVCAGGEIRAVYRKRNLPNYAVFDEQRYFAPGTGESPLVEIGGVRVGVSICEDAFSPTGPIAAQAAGGAELVVNINPGVGRLLRAGVRQPGRRPGRAGVRRCVDGVRRPRRPGDPGPTVRRGDRGL